MRKILSLLLSVFVLCGALLPGQIVAYAEYADITTEQIQILSLIGIQENEFTESALSRNLTRSQFVQYAAYAMGLSDGGCTDKQYYTDINQYSTAGFINTFVEMGILTVGETKEFEPDRQITSDEALKIVISMLGYSTVAEYIGGFPQGYRTQANKLDLNALFSSTTLTAAQGFSLLADALEIPCYDMTEISVSGKVKFSREEGNTLLSIYHSIDTDEGYVRAVNTISLDDSVCDMDEMIVGDNIYAAENLERLEDYLGLYVKLYYKDDKSGGKHNAVLVLHDSKNDTVTLNTQDVEDLDSGYNLKAWNEKSQSYKQYKIARNVIVIKNGCPEKSDIRDIVRSLNYGTLKLIKSDNGMYDCIIIKDYIPVLISTLSYEKDAIYDKLTNLRLDIGNYEYVSIMDENRNKIDSSALSAGDVLSVAIGSENNKYIEIIKSLSSVSGTIDSIEKRDADTICAINSMEYKVCKEYLLKNTISVGTKGAFMIDIFGNIADIRVGNDSDKKLGLLIDIAFDDMFNSSFKLKIFDSTGKMQVYSVSDNIVVDGIRYRDLKDAADLLNNKESNGSNVQVIQYVLDSDNIMKEIDTSKVSEKEEADKSLRAVTPARNGFVSRESISSGGTSRRLASNMYFNANTIIFGVPSVEKLANNDYTDDDFSIVEYTALKYGLELDGKTKGYYTSRDNPYVSALTVNRSYITTQSTFSSHLYILTDVTERLDSDNCPQKYYTFYNSYDRKKYEYYLGDDVDSKADIGDTVILNADNKGCISDISVLYDASEGGPAMTQSTEMTWNGNFYTDGSLNVAFVYAGYIAGNVIHGTFDRSGTAFDDNVAIDASLYQPIIIDSSKKDKNQMVRLGDERDIRDMNTVNIYDCSLILLAYRGLDVTGVIVYN